MKIMEIEIETLGWLEDNTMKLGELESMIRNLQYNANDKDGIKLTQEELKMEIFRLWYFVQYGKKYDL